MVGCPSCHQHRFLTDLSWQPHVQVPRKVDCFIDNRLEGRESVKGGVTRAGIPFSHALTRTRSNHQVGEPRPLPVGGYFPDRTMASVTLCREEADGGSCLSSADELSDMQNKLVVQIAPTVASCQALFPVSLPRSNIWNR